MLIPPKHITAYYWDSNLRGFPGPVDYNYYNNNLAYNLEPGQTIHRITYDKALNIKLEFEIEITIVSEKGVGFFTKNNEKKYYPYESEYGKLIITPCYHFYSLQDLEDWLDGKEPHEDGRWYKHGGWRTPFPDRYSEENLKNFEKMGQMKLKLN